MTHLKQLGSKLISLLAAFAMILSLMPAVSLTAGAAPITAANELDKGKPQYGDGWTWDGDTLHLFGSNTYDCSSQIYFQINSADNALAVIDISGSLNVTLNNCFVMSYRPLEIKGAGKITATGTGGLFDTNRRPLSYAGGAICSDGAINISCSSFTMTKGHIEAPNAFISASSVEISDSYVSLSEFHTPANIGATKTDITINKSFVDTKSLTGDTSASAKLHFTLVNSVMRSAAAKSEFTKAYAPVFDTVTDSVVYLTKVDSIADLTLDKALTEKVNSSIDGGYVFCNRVLTNDDLSKSQLDGSNLGVSTLSGAFYKSAADDLVYIANLELTGGILIVTPFDSLTIGTGASANKATIVLLSQYEEPTTTIGLSTRPGSETKYFKDCTIVAMNEFDGTNSNSGTCSIKNATNCNVYSPTSGEVYTMCFDGEAASMSTPDTSSNFYVPNGQIQIYASDCDTIYSNITTKSIIGNCNFTYHGNYCAESFETTKKITFDGSNDYSVSFSGVNVTGSGKINLTTGTEFAYEKPSNGQWKPLSIDSTGYTGSTGTQLYIGKQILNTLADPTKSYDSLKLFKDLPAVIDIPLSLPYNQWVNSELTLADSGGTTYKPGDLGISWETSGSGNTLRITLTAGDNVKDGSYKLYCTINGQKIKGKNGDYISLTVSQYADYTMTFSSYLRSSWPYITEDGELAKFTEDDYGEIIKAKTWTWYGEDYIVDGKRIYDQRTLVLKDGFSFSTGLDNGIVFINNFHLVVNGNCTINAVARSIYGEALQSNPSLEIKGNSDSTLTINRGIGCQGGNIRIVGGNIRTAKVNTGSDAVVRALLDGSEIFLNNCSIIDNANVWSDKQSISSQYLKISRGVTLDLASSTVSGSKGIYIGDILNAENIGDFSDAKNIELKSGDSPYNGNITQLSNKAADRMMLVTKPFKLTDPSNIVVADDTVPFKGKCLWGGEKYRVDITDKFSVTSGLDQTIIYEDYKFSIERAGGKTYLVIEVPNTNTDSVITPEINLYDQANDTFCSHESVPLKLTIGRAVKASKIGILHAGSYGGSEPTDCYTISAECNGSEVQKKNGDECDYYLFPSSDTLKLNIIPTAGHMIKQIWNVDWGNTEYEITGQAFGLSPSGDYLFGHTDGESISNQIYIEIADAAETQYKAVSISDELRDSLVNDEIDAIKLTFTHNTGNTTEKTFDKNRPSPVYALNGAEIKASITAPNKFVAEINGVKPDYDNGVYSVNLTITDDTIITAKIEKGTELGTLAVTALDITGNNDNGQVLTQPDTANGYYKEGTECEIIVKATDDKFIDSVKFNGTEIEADSNDSDGWHYKFKTAAGENKFDVTYADCAQITIAQLVNGSVDFTGRLDGGRHKVTVIDDSQIISIGAGDEVTLTVTPDEGYRVKSATMDGNEVTLTDGKYTFTMAAGCEFRVEFEEIPATNATVTVNCGEHGTVTPATADYPIGTEVTLTVTPDSGYRVKSATMDGEAVTLTDGKYTFTLTENCIFSVEFEEIPATNATVTVNCGEHGTVTPATADYPIGTEVTLTVTPDSGYRVKSATMDGEAVTLTDGKYTFTLTADCEFGVEFEEIPVTNATVTVNCGEHGTVTPATADYPIGTEVTLTVTPDSGYRVKSATMDGEAVTLTDGKYTFTLTADCEFSVEFQKKPTGGSSSGGHSYTGSGSTGNRESVPALNGESRSWNEISSDLSKMDENSRADVYMNGSTSIPSAVLKEIKDKKISVVFRFDSNKSWTVDGSMITSDYASADLYLLPGTSTEKGARGSAGYRFSTGGNDVGAVLNIQFKNEYVGKFANLYFIKDGKAEFAGTSRVDENGYAAMPGASAKGEYVVMLCDYSDLLGDVTNDGVVNALDASAILKEIVEIALCENPEMGDFNISGAMTALDAAAILKHIVF